MRGSLTYTGGRQGTVGEALGRRGTDLGRARQKKILKEWQDKWRVTQPARGPRNARPPNPATLELHKGLSKAESSVLIQARTGEICLAHFLHQRKVPGMMSDRCSCGVGVETVWHVTEYCSKETGRRDEIRRRDDRLPLAV